MIRLRTASALSDHAQILRTLLPIPSTPAHLSNLRTAQTMPMLPALDTVAQGAGFAVGAVAGAASLAPTAGGVIATAAAANPVAAGLVVADASVFAAPVVLGPMGLGVGAAGKSITVSDAHTYSQPINQVLLPLRYRLQSTLDRLQVLSRWLSRS